MQYFFFNQSIMTGKGGKFVRPQRTISNVGKTFRSYSPQCTNLQPLSIDILAQPMSQNPNASRCNTEHYKLMCCPHHAITTICDPLYHCVHQLATQILTIATKNHLLAFVIVCQLAKSRTSPQSSHVCRRHAIFIS